MREIKFRAWDKKYNYMIEPEDIHPRVMNECITGDGRVLEINETNSYMGTDISYEDISDTRILMQYTGFKDIHSKEIYEGDLVKYYDEIDGITELFGVVEWERGSWTVNLHPKYLRENDIMDIEDYFQYEVLGNVFDIPDWNF